MNRLIFLLFGIMTFVAHAQVPTYVPTEGLVAWYSFNGNSNDESGNGNEGITQNVQLTSDRFGNENAAYAFDGISSYVFVESDFDLNERSTCLWVRAAAIENSLIYDTDNNNLEFGLTQFGCGTFGSAFGIGVGFPGGENTYFNSTAIIDTWYMLAFTRDADSTKYYFNGNLEHTVANGNFSSVGGAVGTWFGVRRGAGDRFFYGSIDDIGIWATALTESEILALYNAEILLTGCIDPTACNYNGEAYEDDGSCTYPPFGLTDCEAGGTLCGEGTLWDTSLQACVGFNDCPSDFDGDGIVGVNDLLSLLSEFGTECPPAVVEWTCGTPVNYQSYDYATVQIGEQCWFAENLRAELYQNEDSIPGDHTNEEWSETSEGAQAIYENDSLNLIHHGRLYNWYAVNDNRGLCPSGWHVPTDGEWTILENYLGGALVAGEKLKSINVDILNWNGTNSSGFSASPSGKRMPNGQYIHLANNFWAWTSTLGGYNPEIRSWSRNLYAGWNGCDTFEQEFRNGMSVRCLKD